MNKYITAVLVGGVLLNSPAFGTWLVFDRDMREGNLERARVRAKTEASELRAEADHFTCGSEKNLRLDAAECWDTIARLLETPDLINSEEWTLAMGRLNVFRLKGLDQENAGDVARPMRSPLATLPKPQVKGLVKKGLRV